MQQRKKTYTFCKIIVDYIIQYCIFISMKQKIGVKMKKKKNTLLCKIKDNLLWIFLVIQTLTLLAVFFDVNVDIISQYLERGFWVVALYLSKKLGG